MNCISSGSFEGEGLLGAISDKIANSTVSLPALRREDGKDSSKSEG